MGTVTRNFANFATGGDDKLVNDLSTLALREATQSNRVAVGTNSQYIDVFQDDTGYTNGATTSRNSSEYVSSIYDTSGQYTSDSNTLLLLHGDGSNDGTTFTDSSSNSRSAIVTGTVVTKTAIKKFGTSSIYFGDGDGSAGSHGNALSWADSTDWNAGTNEWTVECWTYITSNASVSGNSSFEYGGQAYSDSTDNGGSYHMSIQADGQFQHNTYNRSGTGNNAGNYQVQSGGSNTVPLNTWTHLAWTRQGNNIRLYKNGVQSASGAISSDVSYKMLNNNDLGGKWWLSRRAYNSNYGYIRGYVDEYRISNNNRYPDGTSFTPGNTTVASATGNFTCPAITASSTSSMGAMITYQDQHGTNALNTDIVLQLSADNGSNFSTATLTAMPDFSSGIKMAKVNDLAVTAGTQLKYKILFANQASGSKEARIRGVSLNY